MSIRRIAVAVAVLACFAVPARAGSIVTYDFIEGLNSPNPGTIGAILEFKSPPASPTAGWSTSNPSDIVSFQITDAAIGPAGAIGSVDILPFITSTAGTGLDIGIVSGVVDGIAVLTAVVTSGTGVSKMFATASAGGDWFLATQAVPEPSSMFLAGIAAAAGLGAWARRRNRNV
jgi:hypothetical protein